MYASFMWLNVVPGFAAEILSSVERTLLLESGEKASARSAFLASGERVLGRMGRRSGVICWV